MQRSNDKASARSKASSSRDIRLPAAISWQSFKPIYLLIWLPYILVYQVTNRFPIFEPTTLPLTELDKAVPFVPQLLPLYISYLAYYFVTVSRMENDREINRLFYATHVELFISATIFILFPVRMPRELYYQPEIYNWADAFWRWFDAPNNCLPSLHASNCLLLMQFNWRRRHRVIYLAFGASIIASTLFVKQHYVVDLFAGAGVYLVARWFVSRLVITRVDEYGWRVDRGNIAPVVQNAHRTRAVSKNSFSKFLVVATMALLPCRVGLGWADQASWSAPASVSESGTTTAPGIGATQLNGYTGSGACATCHQAEHTKWQNSGHAWAMKQNVRPNSHATFGKEPVKFGNDGTVSFDVTENQPLSVNISEAAENDRMESGDRDVVYLFGNRAIEQHLVLDHDGRYQALPIGFDLEKQQWFDLFPGDARAVEDWGHWSNRGMTANSECIACHTTGFEKGYNAANDSYQTTWAELGVGCEACHGPGAAHVEEQRNIATATSSPSRYGLFDAATTLETCAPCHSLRREVWPGFVPGGVEPDGHVTGSWLNYFEPVLLDEPEFHFDGQLSGEAYEWASFLQSRMHREGVTCSNCHEIHSGTLKEEGNALCLSCHEPKFASVEHTHHAFDNEGSQCVSCHMPRKVFMARDVRRDHSLRIPDPVLNTALGTPNVCTACHEDKDGDWAAQYWTSWWGRLRNDKPRSVSLPRPLRSLGADKSETFACSSSALTANARQLSSALQPPNYWLHLRTMNACETRLSMPSPTPTTSSAPRRPGQWPILARPQHLKSRR